MKNIDEVGRIKLYDQKALSLDEANERAEVSAQQTLNKAFDIYGVNSDEFEASFERLIDAREKTAEDQGHTNEGLYVVKREDGKYYTGVGDNELAFSEKITEAEIFATEESSYELFEHIQIPNSENFSRENLVDRGLSDREGVLRSQDKILVLGEFAKPEVRDRVTSEKIRLATKLEPIAYQDMVSNSFSEPQASPNMLDKVKSFFSMKSTRDDIEGKVIGKETLERANKIASHLIDQNPSLRESASAESLKGDLAQKLIYESIVTKKLDLEVVEARTFPESTNEFELEN